MPRFDGTGPNGMGPMTGRGRGYCIVDRVNNKILPSTLRFFGFRRRRPFDFWGRGRRLGRRLSNWW